jgi:hypothetical protein
MLLILAGQYCDRRVAIHRPDNSCGAATIGLSWLIAASVLQDVSRRTRCVESEILSHKIS